MIKTLGGERISSGKKMKVELHGYERSTHNLSRVVRTTMAAGTLVPFMDSVALPADTWDIELHTEVMTHPTIGPLFGSYKVDLHVFQAPYRLYNALLHNNMLGIGRDMSQAKLPQIEFTVPPTDMDVIEDLNTAQVNPSSLIAYLGIRGFGFNPEETEVTRQFNATSILAYWETYKNYYANKQEEIGAVIHSAAAANIETVDAVKIINGATITTLPEIPTAPVLITLTTNSTFKIEFTGTQPLPEQIMINTTNHGIKSLAELTLSMNLVSAGVLAGMYNHTLYGTQQADNWRYTNSTDLRQIAPQVVTFPLSNIDDMRYEILSTPSKVAPFVLNDITPELEPYKFLYETSNNVPNVLGSQEGLAIKTYQSDIFNNWLNTENIEAITNASSIDTSGGFFTIDQLLIGRAVYNLLNRINVSGGTYDDWLEVVYDHEAITRCESPIYHGGLIKELIFQEVVSNSESQSGQPLGTLAGKGTLANKHKGGRMTIKVDEPSVILGLISITPRIDYSQGNEWYTGLKTLDDLHKPQFDQIGFQDLPTTGMAWWDSSWDATTSTWTVKSAGKQPAWINYMTETNKLFGNFAIPNNEMFMVLNRRYEHTDDAVPTIKDLTTYIDPSKFNFIFAETQLDAQNFWVQIGIQATVRRKMSAKLMPNL